MRTFFDIHMHQSRTSQTICDAKYHKRFFSSFEFICIWECIQMIFYIFSHICIASFNVFFLQYMYIFRLDIGIVIVNAIWHSRFWPASVWSDPGWVTTHRHIRMKKKQSNDWIEKIVRTCDAVTQKIILFFFFSKIVSI